MDESCTTLSIVPFSSSGKQSGTRLNGADGLLSQSGQPHQAPSAVPFSSSGKQSGTRITGADGLLSQSGQPNRVVTAVAADQSSSRPRFIAALPGTIGCVNQEHPGTSWNILEQPWNILEHP